MPDLRPHPAHAHHIRFGQAKGIALKVSDEFTVPLCAVHHSENHATGDERRWWQQRKIDPLAIATELWGKTLHRDSTNHVSGTTYPTPLTPKRDI